MVQNKYTRRDGLIGGGSYRWADGATAAIIDVGLTATLGLVGDKDLHPDVSSCEYTWEVSWVSGPSGRAMFDGEWLSGGAPPSSVAGEAGRPSGPAEEPRKVVCTRVVFRVS